MSFLKTPPRVLFVALLRVLSYFEFFKKRKKKRKEISGDFAARRCPTHFWFGECGDGAGSVAGDVYG